MSAAQDKLRGIASTQSGRHQSGLTTYGKGIGTGMKNLVDAILFPLVTKDHTVPIAYGETTPVDDTIYDSLPIGAIYLQFVIASSAVSNMIVWVKRGAGAWETLGAGGTSIPDPGNTAKAISVEQNGICPIVTAGAETRTLAAPSYLGQQITLNLKTDGGDAVVTVATAVNQTGNNTLTFADAGDEITLRAVYNGANLRWRVASNDGVALATV